MATYQMPPVTFETDENALIILYKLYIIYGFACLLKIPSSTELLRAYIYLRDKVQETK